ncbi:hypothetical protein [Brevundimonas sp. UBA7534]|uniref:hypothetical protein n=1 Tax=Brevundimonas sp. UBA7534 TaxID=1946138 RepID=UPI0025C2D14C|nr:hypothetical protein [Brevundimonas sp. UBA7534]
MKRLTPFAVLVIFGLIGLLTGKFGLWFPFGLVAAIVVAVVQDRRAKAAALKDQSATDG